MTIRNIRIFLAVVHHHNNVSEAARALYLSQPSVSVAIQEIEREYQVQLFERLSHRLYLTDAGREFLEYAQRIASIFDDMDRELQGWNAHGTIRIGASITIGSQKMPAYVKLLQEVHPGVKIFVRVGFSRDLEKMLLVNDLDLAIVETPVHHPELEAVQYGTDCLDLVMPTSPRYAAGLEMPRERFLSENLLLREKGSGARDVFDRVMAEHGIESVTPLWEATSTTALLHAVESGLGVTVLPRLAADSAVREGRVYRGSIQGIAMQQAFFIVCNRDKMQTPLMQDFVKIVKENA